MAAPNIASVVSMYLRSRGAAVPSSTGTLLGPIAADLVAEVFSGYVTNIDGAAAVDVTLTLVKAAGSTAIVSTIPVEPDTAQTVITQDAPVVMEEGDYITGLASAANDAVALFSYREYNDA